MSLSSTSEQPSAHDTHGCSHSVHTGCSHGVHAHARQYQHLHIATYTCRYAALLARNSRPDTRATLGAHHPRGLVLPFAVSGAHNGVREFKISGGPNLLTITS